MTQTLTLVKAAAFLAHKRKIVTDLAALHASTDSYSEGEVVELLREGWTYQVASSAATDHHLTTQRGVKLYVLPKDGEVPLKAFGAVGDGVTNDTTAIQKAVNFASNNNVIIAVEPGEYLCTKIYGYYDAALNSGFNADPGTAGLWGLACPVPVATSNSAGDQSVGARFISNAASGCPFEFVRPSGEANAFYARKLTLRNIVFKGATTDAPVLRTNNIQEPSFQNVHVIASGAIAGPIWQSVDCDQQDIRDVLVFGPGSGSAGSVGVEIYNDGIDSSRGRIDGLLIRAVESAGVIGGSVVTPDDAGDVMRNMVFGRLASNDVINGLIFGGRLERCVFDTPQCRGEKDAATLRGQQVGCLYLAPSFHASAPAAANDYEAQVVIGHPDATSGVRKFSGCVMESPDFPSVPAGTPAIRWRGATRLEGMHVRQPRAYLEDATARLVHFNGAATGGTLSNVHLDGNGFTPDLSHVVDSAGNSPVGRLHKFSYESESDILGWSDKNRLSGNAVTSVASAASISLIPALSHNITGTVDISTIQIDGVDPVNGMQIILRFSGALSLLSTTGTGAGNIKFNGGDHAVASGDVVTLTWMNGGWRARA